MDKIIDFYVKFDITYIFEKHFVTTANCSPKRGSGETSYNTLKTPELGDVEWYFVFLAMPTVEGTHFTNGFPNFSAQDILPAPKSIVQLRRWAVMNCLTDAVDRTLGITLNKLKVRLSEKANISL